MNKSTFWSISIIAAISIVTITLDMSMEKKIGIVGVFSLLLVLLSLGLQEEEEEETLEHAFECSTVTTRDNVVVHIEGTIHYTPCEVAEEDKPKEQYKDLAIQMMQDMAEGYVYTQIKQMTFYELLSNRYALHDELVHFLNKKVTEWGVKVDYLFLQSIKLSDEMKEAMFNAAISSFTQKQTSLSEADTIKTIASAIPKGQGNTLHYLLAKEYITSLNELASSENNNMILMPFEANKILDQVDTTLNLKKNQKHTS